MTDTSGGHVGERVAAIRRRRGLSQKDLAAEMRRSESWVSQVERGVQPVERLSVLQALANVLGVFPHDLRPDAGADLETADQRDEANDLDGLRTALTGHPALRVLLDDSRGQPDMDLADASVAVEHIWELAHLSRFAELTNELTPLLPRLEEAARQAKGRSRHRYFDLLAKTYQAVAAAFARQGEDDAAWLAADRALNAAEHAGQPLSVIAAHFRMAHAFIGSQRLDQAERVAQVALDALRPLTEQPDCPVETLSLYGAMNLVLAVIAAREGSRAKARERIAEATKSARRIGADRNDFNTEFGPTNVQLHAASVAVDLGDAGEALELAKDIDATQLSPERQARFLIDIARAHALRRHTDDAIAALLQAEQITPEMVATHPHARDTIRELIQLTGRRAPHELTELARRATALP